MQIEVNGLSMHVETYGESGDPILMLHGALSDNAQNWRMIVPQLSARHRLIGVDMRGHGRTSNPTGSFTLEHLRDDALAVLDALDIPRAHLLGCSLGGYVSLALRAAHPERVGTLALAGVKVGWEADDSRMRGEFFRSENIERTYPLWAPHMAKAHSHHHGLGHWKTLIDQVRHLLQGLPEREALSLARLEQERDQRGLFYVLGDREEMVAIEEVVKIRAARPDAEILVVPRAGHLFREYDPTVFSTAYLNFLRRRRLEA